MSYVCCARLPALARRANASTNARTRTRARTLSCPMPPLADHSAAKAHRTTGKGQRHRVSLVLGAWGQEIRRKSPRAVCTLHTTPHANAPLAWHPPPALALVRMWQSPACGGASCCCCCCCMRACCCCRCSALLQPAACMHAGGRPAGQGGGCVVCNGEHAPLVLAQGNSAGPPGLSIRPLCAPCASSHPQRLACEAHRPVRSAAPVPGRVGHRERCRCFGCSFAVWSCCCSCCC